MGLLKGSVTFSRYRLIGSLPDHFTDYFNEQIRKNAFNASWRTAEEKAVGWTIPWTATFHTPLTPRGVTCSFHCASTVSPSHLRF
jgi:hypothetical protein